MIPDSVEKKVITSPAPGEILLGIVNDPIYADGSNHVHISCTAHAGHICAERLGDLHSERTHASRCTIDQDLLPRLNLSLVAKTLQSGECRNRYTSRLLKRHVVRFHDQRRFHDSRRLASTRILGKCPTACAKHRVAWFDLRYVSANRFNLASHVNAEVFDLWFAQPEQYTNDERPACHCFPVEWIDGSRADFYQ